MTLDPGPGVKTGAEDPWTQGLELELHTYRGPFPNLV